MAADLHCHSRHSDGVETPARLVEMALEAGLDVLALSDHDTLSGIGEALDAASGTGLRIVPGVEFSSRGDGEDVHILGLFLDPADAGLAARLDELREERRSRGEKMLARLEEQGVAIDAAQVRDEVGEGAFGRPHIARGLVRAGLAESIQDAFERWLRPGGPAFVPKPRIDPGEAIDLTHRVGGVAVIAHPIWSKDPEGLIEHLADLGLDGIEVRHPQHDDEFEQRMRRLAARLGLAVSAGSDYHETGVGRRVGGSTIDQAEFAALEARRPG